MVMMLRPSAPAGGQAFARRSMEVAAGPLNGLGVWLDSRGY